jgi:ubiquinone biosynthesis protein UbiJ
MTPPAWKPGPSRRAANSVMPNRPTEPDVPERAYGRLNTRIDRLEDAMNHFYNVINKLRERVSTLEKKLERLSH